MANSRGCDPGCGALLRASPGLRRCSPSGRMAIPCWGMLIPFHGVAPAAVPSAANDDVAAVPVEIIVIPETNGESDAEGNRILRNVDHIWIILRYIYHIGIDGLDADSPAVG